MNSLLPIFLIAFVNDQLKRKSVFMTFLEQLMLIIMGSLLENNGIQILIKLQHLLKLRNKICSIQWINLKVLILSIIKLFFLLSAIKTHPKSMLLKSLIGLKIPYKKLKIGIKIPNLLFKIVSKLLIKMVTHT